MKLTKLIPAFGAAGCLAGTLLQAADPVVSNVRASQRSGDKLVDIQYNVAYAGTNWLAVTVAVSTNGGTTANVPATHFSGDGSGFWVTPGTNKLIVWDARADWDGRYSTNVRFQVTVNEVPAGMVPIPAGSFTMGDSLDGNPSALPLHTVQVSAFYMDQYEVTKALWDEVRVWANSNGYDLGTTGLGKATNHPVHTVNWYDVLKWCNARSERDGWLPAYYTSAAQATVYRTGSVAVQNDWVRWGAGYRLPTEAEWEKGARGGASGHRFPWVNTDNITHSLANYYSDSRDAYDTSPTRSFHPTFNDGVIPYTSPVGYFAANGNGYGLYDMTGNVSEWTWDLDGSYSSSAQADPRGPTSGLYRVFRGGGWFSGRYSGAAPCRSADRDVSLPTGRIYYRGFRVVLSPGQQ